MAVSFVSPESGLRVPRGFMRPEIMAIGDSLYNGMRSGTITAELAEASVPALVADAHALGEKFAVPDYPLPVLVDLEGSLRDMKNLFRLPRRLKRMIKALGPNARFWMSHSETDGPPAFDNIAVSGYEVTHVIDRSWADWAAERDRIWAKFKDKKPMAWLRASRPGIVDFHLAINSVFVLNPTGHEALAPLRPIDLVAWRRPKRLLVSLGSNHGLVALSLEKDFETGMKRLRKYPREAGRLAEHLAALPGGRGGVQHIYVNNLLLPSMLGNIMPPFEDQQRGLPAPGPGNYFPTYEKRLASAYHRFSGDDLREVDAFVADINRQVEARMRAAFGDDDRLHIVDVNRLQARYDGKHDPAKKIVLHGNRYSNNMLVCNPHFPWRRNGFFRSGGIFSLDNHHPTTLGYAVLADLVLEAIEQHEGIETPQPIQLEAFDYSLLEEIPNIWSKLPWIVLGALRAGVGQDGEVADAASSDDEKEAALDLSDLMMSVGAGSRTVIDRRSRSRR